jgi:hypothetical protein
MWNMVSKRALILLVFVRQLFVPVWKEGSQAGGLSVGSESTTDSCFACPLLAANLCLADRHEPLV